MAAAMNGMALHGGVIPYGGTFLCFADYARGAMRLSALMGVAGVYVMTHDSIGLGEDGPTHQPVEHLAMLRATPNLNVFRPADTVETAEAWEIALTSADTPSVLALTRQNLPTVRTEHKGAKNLTASGAYVLAEADGQAAGDPDGHRLRGRDRAGGARMLEAEGIGTRVVSMPCWELFEAQDEAYRRRVLPARPGARGGRGRGAFRLGPLAREFGIGERGKREKSGFVGMEGFGASARGGDLYRDFGITAEAVATEGRSGQVRGSPGEGGPSPNTAALRARRERRAASGRAARAPWTRCSAYRRGRPTRP
jgi:transketolase